MLSSVAHCGIELPCEALYGPVCHFMSLFVILWLYMAFSRGHRSKFIFLNLYLQIEIIDTDYEREEAVYDCCPNEKYPNIKLSFSFKMLGKYEHGKMLRP